jgi:hypothetical protein
MSHSSLAAALLALAITGHGANNLLNAQQDRLLNSASENDSLDFQIEPTSAGVRTQPFTLGLPVALDLTRASSREMLQGLETLLQGNHLSVRVSATETAVYVIDLHHESDGTVEIRGHLLANPDKRIVLGINQEGASGFFELANGKVHALAYADGIQVAGIAGDDWMTDRLQPEALRERTPGRHEEPPVQGAMAIDIDLPQLTKLRAGDQTVMLFPGMGAARVAMERIDIGEETATWVGHLADFGDNYPVLVTYSADAIEGSALTPQGEIVLTSGHAYNPQQLGLRNAKIDGENCAVAAQDIADSATAHAATTTTSPVTANVAKAAAATANTIDVLVYYSPDMESLYGSATGVATRIDALFAAANQAYAAGNLGYTLRRVGLKKVATADTTSNDSVLSRLQAGTGEFAAMPAERNAAGADLVSVIRPLRASLHGSCGVAYVGGFNGSDINQYVNHMTSVISDGNDRTGAPYYCDTMTLAHETGHNLGLMHDRATSASQGGGTGVKPYAFGYSFSNTWGTIMSYTSPVQYRFSNPNDRTCPGNQACGVASSAANSADNVLALSYSLPLVSAFRPATTATLQKFTVSGVVSLDGKAVAGASIAPSNASATCSTSGATGMYTCQAEKGSTFTITPSISLTNDAKVTWSPANASFSAIAANATANFSGASAKVSNLTVSGKLMLDAKPVANGALKITGSGASCSVSNSAGAFTCSVTPGATFSLAPNIAAPAGYNITWTPPSISYANLRANSSTANFTGASAALKYTLSGKVILDGKPVAGTTPKLSGAGVTCGASNASGVFSCTANAGASITLTPNVIAKSGTRLAWTPASITYNKIAGNASNANFTGTTISLSRSITGKVSVVAGGVVKPIVGATIKPSVSGVSCNTTNSTGSFSCTTTSTSAFTLLPTFTKAGYTFRWMAASIPGVGNANMNFVGSITCPTTGCKL